MNTYNHHRVLEAVPLELFKQAVKDRTISQVYESFLKYQDVFESASDYADHYPINLYDETPFFFFHFYYDIGMPQKTQRNKGVIELRRCNKESDNNYKTSFLNCDYEGGRHLSKKSFFTIINNRDYWLKNSIKDKSNQSDCVAFLHAMSASKKDGNTVMVDNDALSIFKQHLTNCFLEYLVIKDDEQAAFILGIALHSIMDSFTPSHMNFQPYAIQDEQLHAQGDVVPFRNDPVRFEPGQYTDDGKASHYKSYLAAFTKGYNGDDDIGIEFEMFKIFTAIGGIEDDDIVKSILEGKIDVTQTKIINDEFTSFRVPYISKKKINDLIKDKKYSESAFELSDAAIKVVADVFKHLCLIRNQEGYDFQKYKNAKGNIEDVVKLWEKKYNSLEILRNDLFKRIRKVRGIVDDTKNPFEK